MAYKEIWETDEELPNGEEDFQICEALAQDADVALEIAFCFAEDAGLLVNDGWQKPQAHSHDYLSYGL